MSIKRKLRRAFDSQKPNVLGGILEDCPPPREKHAKTPKKKLSGRTKEFIATAASLAILISAVAGGWVYFRNYYSGAGGLENPGVPGTAPSRYPQPSYEPVDTCPTDPTREFDTSPEALITRTDDILGPLELRDSIYTVPDIPVDKVLVADQTCYRIHREMNGYCYEFLFDADSGWLISVNVLPCDCIKEGYMSPHAAAYIAAMAVAPEYFGGIASHHWYDVRMAEEGVWEISVFLENVCYLVRVDATTGMLMESAVVELKPPLLKLRDIALDVNGVALENVKTLKIGDEGESLIFYYEDHALGYTVILAPEGSILDKSEPEKLALRTDETLSGIIGWEKARDIALVCCGYGLNDLLGFVYEYYPDQPDYFTNPNCYHLELYFEDAGFTCLIDAQTGELLEDPAVPQDTIDEGKAIDIACLCADAEAYAAGAITDISCKFDPDALVYWVYFQIGNSAYQVQIDAIHGTALTIDVCTVETTPADGQIDEGTAMHIAWSYAVDVIGAEESQLEITGTGYNNSSYGNAYYDVYLSCGSEKLVIRVHAGSGEILQVLGEDSETAPQLQDQDIVIGVAIKASLFNPGTITKTECYLLGSGVERSYYLVILRGSNTCYVMVDAYTLDIMDYGAVFPSNAVDTNTAVANSLGTLGYEGYLYNVLTLKGLYNDNAPFYCVKYFDVDIDTLYLCTVDALTGKMTDCLTVENYSRS